MTVPAVRLDPLQRLVGLSFGNRLAILHVFTSWSGINLPPQALIAITEPVAFTLIDRGLILSAAGVGAAGAPASLPPIGDQVSGAMLRAYKAWRYPSVEVIHDQPPYFFGMRCALVLNLAKFAATPPTVGISLSAASLGGAITQTTIELSTFRTVKSVTLSSDRMGNLAIDGDVVDDASVRRHMATHITGSINCRTLAVTLTSTEPEFEPG